MKLFYMMVGIPGVGKTTWVKNFITDLKLQYDEVNHSDIIVLSTDAIIEELGYLYGMSYNEMFDDITYSFAEKIMHKIAKFYINKGIKVIIWDQTNLTVKTRKKKLDMIPNDYTKYAVYFEVPTDHDQRLSNREGKTIPYKVISSMKKNLQVPTKEEGFNDVINILA